MPKAKITKSFVDKIPLTEKGQKVYCDSEIPGFYLIVGTKYKTYVAQKDYRGRTKRVTIGKHGVYAPDEARKRAKKILMAIADGIDINKQETGEEITLAETLESYITTRRKLKDSTKREYRYNLNQYMPDWMDKRMVDINKNMVFERHTHIGENHGEYAANSAMRTLRAMFNHVDTAFDICEVNPVNYLSKNKAWFQTKRRESWVKPHELKDWWQAVHALDNETIKDYLCLLLFTGLRRSETAKLRWQDVDMRGKTFILRDTKNGDTLTLPMSDYTYQMFERRKQENSEGEFVFPGNGKTGHLVEPKSSVDKIVKETGIKFTCHDLRRTFTSIAESLDISRYAVKHLLNHRIDDVTGGYIVFDVERLRKPVERIEQFIMEKVNGDV